MPPRGRTVADRPAAKFPRGKSRLNTGAALLRRLGVRSEPLGPNPHPGLIVIQIDGLSAPRLRRYLNRTTMPFLRRMVRRRKLAIQPYSSEIPTSTPAFQAGCFYGTNDHIPGFQFYDRKLRTPLRMGNTTHAQTIQGELPAPGLLSGGSVYSCVFDGGAAGSLFVFSSLLDPARWRFALRLWDLLVLTLLHLGIILRIAALALVELVLAMAEFPRWLRETGRLRAELNLILIRVGLLIIGREMITLNTIMDVQRGVPIIYTNYLGYDECSHYRGPDSAPARLQLRAIDRAIRRIWKATLRSERPYQIILLSDHGQAACVPFEEVSGLPISAWVEGQLAKCPPAPRAEAEDSAPPLTTGASTSAETERLAAMARDQADAFRRVQGRYPAPLRPAVGRVADAIEARALKEPESPTIQPQPRRDRDVLPIAISVSGPTAHISWTELETPMTFQQLEARHPGLVESMLQCDGIGAISARCGESDDVLLFARDGFARILPDGTRTITGTLPPDATAQPRHAYNGIARITRMERSGDLVLWGNGAPAGDVSFLNERGCHAGFSDQETQAFVLAPPGCPVDFSSITRHSQFHGALMGLRPPIEIGKAKP